MSARARASSGVISVRSARRTMSAPSKRSRALSSSFARGAGEVGARRVDGVEARRDRRGRRRGLSVTSTSAARWRSLSRTRRLRSATYSRMTSATIAATATTRTRDAEPAEPFVGREEIADQAVGGEAERERDEDADRAERDAAEQLAAPAVGATSGRAAASSKVATVSGRFATCVRREGAGRADASRSSLGRRRSGLATGRFI